MELISKLSDMIEEELDDAEKYICCARDMKESRPALASVFFNLSVEELKHANLLHEQVVNLINEYKKEHGDPPERMQGIYEYLHKKHINKSDKIKIMQGLFSVK